MTLDDAAAEYRRAIAHELEMMVVRDAAAAASEAAQERWEEARLAVTTAKRGLIMVASAEAIGA